MFADGLEGPALWIVLIFYDIIIKCANFDRDSVVLVYFRLPENWTRGQKYYRTGPGTSRKFMQVLEPDPEPPGGSSQF